MLLMQLSLFLNHWDNTHSTLSTKAFMESHLPTPQNHELLSGNTKVHTKNGVMANAVTCVPDKNTDAKIYLDGKKKYKR